MGKKHAGAWRPVTGHRPSSPAAPVGEPHRLAESVRRCVCTIHNRLSGMEGEGREGTALPGVFLLLRPGGCERGRRGDRSIRAEEWVFRSVSRALFRDPAFFTSIVSFSTAAPPVTATTRNGSEAQRRARKQKQPRVSAREWVRCIATGVDPRAGSYGAGTLRVTSHSAGSRCFPVGWRPVACADRRACFVGRDV